MNHCNSSSIAVYIYLTLGTIGYLLCVVCLHEVVSFERNYHDLIRQHLAIANMVPSLPRLLSDSKVLLTWYSHQLGILKFQTLLLVVLLFICTCTYLHGVFPAALDRNKSGYAILVLRGTNEAHLTDLATCKQGVGNVLAGSKGRRTVESVCEPLLYGDGCR